MENLLTFLSHNKDAFLAGGVFISALSTLIGTWFASRTSHRAAVSQLREKWIDALREDIASFVNKKMSKEIMLTSDRQPDNLDFHAYLEDLYLTKNRILLRLNPNEKTHSELQQAIEDFAQSKEISEEAEARAQITLLSRRIFHEEWIKVAKGKL